MAPVGVGSLLVDAVAPDPALLYSFGKQAGRVLEARLFPLALVCATGRKDPASAPWPPEAG